MPYKRVIDTKIPSKFKPTEQAILVYLYDHPDESIDTTRLTQFSPNNKATDEHCPMKMWSTQSSR